MSLLNILTTLAKDDVPYKDRNSACAALLAELSTWGGGYLRSSVAGKLDDASIDDAFQHLMMQAALGGNRFKGTTEGEAKSWCKVVLCRYVIDQHRKWAKRLDHGSEAILDDGAQSLSTTGDSRSAPNDVEMKESLVRILSDVKAEIGKGRREDSAATLTRSFECHLECRRGDTLEEQVEKWGFEGSSSSTNAGGDALKKARDRVYQYRKRGRDVGCAALTSLADQNKYTDEEIGMMRSILGCHKGE